MDQENITLSVGNRKSIEPVISGPTRGVGSTKLVELQAAVVGGNEQIARLLLENGVEFNEEIHGNALQAASIGGHEQIVRLLLENGAEVNAQGGMYGNALQAASIGGHEQIVRLLLENGAEVNAQGGMYGNALQAASFSRNEQIVRLLLENGAEVNTQGGYYGHALQVASYKGNEQIFHLLLENGAEVNAQGGHYGNALQAASIGGHEQIVRLLLENGAEVNAQGAYGNALQAASYNGNEQIVRLLLENGAEINAQGGLTGNALQAASCGGNEQISRLLLENGAEVNARGGTYGNALRAAFEEGNEQIVRLLLENGAEDNAHGLFQQSALQMASSKGHEHIASSNVATLRNVNTESYITGGTKQDGDSEKWDLELLVEPNLEDYVKSPEFDRECALKARERASASYDSNSDHNDSIWSNLNDGTSSSVSPMGPSPQEISRVEAYLYYAGLGPNGCGPKLIYRTSNDKFFEPEGPRAYRRLMKLCPIPEDHELGQDGLWDRIRDQVVELLDKRHIYLTSVDLVQFTWLDKKEDQEIQEEEGDDDDDDDNAQKDLSYDDIPPIKSIEDGKRYTTNPTVWVAVLPDTLTGAVAHESAIEILGLLKELGFAGGVDVAYRESVAKFLHGPDLFAPVSDLDPLKDVVDNLSTPLSLPIAGRKTTMQGTLGCYFRVENDLYAITVRHNVFLLEGGNEEYNYHKSAPKKEVVVMRKPAFKDYLASIQANINTLIITIDCLEKRATMLTRRVKADGDDAQKSAGELKETQGELTKTRTKINVLKTFFVDVNKKWSKVEDRVIGYIVWAPPIGVGIPPHRYMRDLCVIKLNKKKFRNFRGNVLSLGPEISPANFKALMYDRIDVPSEFDYPEEGLLPVQGMLSAADINNPNSMNVEGDRIRRVIKRGFTTNTTVGTLSGFMSHVRKYSITGNLDSVEVAILPHNSSSIEFSRGGDSGALIVDAHRRFVALLTGGTNKGTRSSDITFATPMEWVWKLVKDKFPGANLYFDDLEAFLADVV